VEIAIVDSMIVIDFETTGLSPAYGERATEIAAVRVEDGCIVERYQSLMNAQRSIPSFITQLTGITNAMVRKAPPAAQVMAEVADFVGDQPLLAHNASFDAKFWDAELERIGRRRQQSFVCSMLIARRVLPQAPSYKLGALVDFAGLPRAARAHRALADAEMAAALIAHLQRELMQRFQLAQISHAMLQAIQRRPKNQLDACVRRLVAAQCAAA
jgi:DNA polymerase-3 subunit epsilon